MPRPESGYAGHNKHDFTIHNGLLQKRANEIHWNLEFAMSASQMHASGQKDAKKCNAI